MSVQEEQESRSESHIPLTLEALCEQGWVNRGVLHFARFVSKDSSLNEFQKAALELLVGGLFRALEEGSTCLALSSWAGQEVSDEEGNVLGKLPSLEISLQSLYIESYNSALLFNRT